jgi:ribonuclease H2 subunit B
MLIHYPVDPLFLVIPLLFPLTRVENGNTVPFQPLSSLISTISASPAHSLVAPFTKEKAPTAGWNEDVDKLLGIKSVRRVFKLCCERKSAPKIHLS